MKRAFKDADIKYIDPTYMIRAIPTTSNDRIYCKILAHNAVHAAFAGFTGGAPCAAAWRQGCWPIPGRGCQGAALPPRGWLQGSPLAPAGPAARA
jgi:hypothetical protein